MPMWFLHSFFFCLQLCANWEAFLKTCASCFTGNNKNVGLQPQAFISFLVFGYPGKTLALVFEILLNKPGRCHYHVNRQDPLANAHHSLTNKEASTVLCSVVKHAGSCRTRKKCREKHKTLSSFFPHFFSALQLPNCFTTQQSTAGASLLFCLMIKNSIISPTHSLTKLYFPKEWNWCQLCTNLW